MSRGYPVLPDHELPSSDAACRAAVATWLEHSALSVHLLGASPGAVPDGEGEESVVVIQNALAVQRARVAPLLRVVSLPDGTVSRDDVAAVMVRLLDAPRPGTVLELVSGTTPIDEAFDALPRPASIS